MKRALLFTGFFWSCISLAQFDGTLKYLNADVYQALKPALPPPPAKNSFEQKKDEEELMRWQKLREEKDCKRAEMEIEATLANLYGPPNGPLKPPHVEKLDEFFKTLRNEAAAFIGKFKSEFVRQRPYQTNSAFQPCVKRETSNSYPSGHAIFAELYAHVLADLYPAQAKEIWLRSDQIGKDRVMAGVHYPSDVAGGRKAGRMLYEALKNSKKYQEAFRKLK